MNLILNCKFIRHELLQSIWLWLGFAIELFKLQQTHVFTKVRYTPKNAIKLVRDYGRILPRNETVEFGI